MTYHAGEPLLGQVFVLQADLADAAQGQIRPVLAALSPLNLATGSVRVLPPLPCPGPGRHALGQWPHRRWPCRQVVQSPPLQPACTQEAQWVRQCLFRAREGAHLDHGRGLLGCKQAAFSQGKDATRGHNSLVAGAGLQRNALQGRHALRNQLAGQGCNARTVRPAAKASVAVV